MTGLPVTGIVAAAIGVVLAVVGYLITRTSGSPAPSMVVEGRAAVGALVLLVIGPLWLLQILVTLVATIFFDATAWLWAWLFLAPFLGCFRITAPAKQP